MAGTVRACVAPSKLEGKHGAAIRNVLIMEFLKDMGTAAAEGRVLNHAATKGNNAVDLNSLSGTPGSAGYCVQASNDPSPED